MNNYAISVPFGLFTEANGHFGVVSSLDWINLFNGTWSCGAITPHDFQYTLIIIDFDYTIRQLSFTSSSTACNKYPWCNTIDQTMVGDAAKEVWRMSLVASPVWAIVLFCFIPPFFILNQTQWLLSRTPLSSLFTCNSPKLLSWSHWLLLLNLYIFQNKTIVLVTLIIIIKLIHISKQNYCPYWGCHESGDVANHYAHVPYVGEMNIINSFRPDHELFLPCTN